MKNILLLLTVLFILTACTPAEFTVNLKPSTAARGTGELIAGAARVEITPPPGYAMGGNSFEAKTSKGFWTRLFSRAVFMQDSTGVPLILVSTELWSVTDGLCNHIVELVQDTLPFIGRENVLIAAMHTHQSPGNFASSSYYNIFAQNEPGFNRSLFEFLSRKIARSIVLAYRSAVPAIIELKRTRISNAVRNRSFIAFNSNPEANAILSANSNLPIGSVTGLFPDTLAFRAVEPELKLLSFISKKERSIIADAIFFAMHPNSLGAFPDYYNSGALGAVSLMLENEKTGSNYIAAVFNGPEGDISPIFEKQGITTTVKLASNITNYINALRNVPGSKISNPKIANRYISMKIRDTALSQNNKSIRTARTPMPGDVVTGGAEDGRSFMCNILCEGTKTTSHVAPEQMPKSIVIPSMVSDLAPDFFKNALPERVPIAIYNIDQLQLCSLPGEFTTTLGMRIKKRLQTGGEPILIGLANDYISYMTTKEEYEAQHYEGASTLYGKNSGELFLNNFVSLSAAPPNRKFYGSIDYNAGFLIDEKIDRKYLNEFEKRQSEHARKNILTAKGARCCCVNEAEELPAFKSFQWYDSPAELSEDAILNPSVAVESAPLNSSEWTLFETDNNLNMLMRIAGKKLFPRIDIWELQWFYKNIDKTKKYRVVINKINGETETTNEFVF